MDEMYLSEGKIARDGGALCFYLLVDNRKADATLILRSPGDRPTGRKPETPAGCPRVISGTAMGEREMEKGEKRKKWKKEENQFFNIYGKAEHEKLLHRSKHQLEYGRALSILQEAIKYAPVTPEKYRELYNELGLRKLIPIMKGPEGLCPFCLGLVYPYDKSGKKNNKKYCSEICKERAKSKRWREKNPKGKLLSNLKYLRFLKKEGII